MKSKNRFAVLVIFLCTCSMGTFAQKSTLVGINVIAQLADGLPHPGVGATIERKFSRNIGLESGLYYLTYRNDFNIIIYGPNQAEAIPVNVLESYLSLPILFKYYSRIVNVSIGPAFNAYLGYSTKNDKSDLLITDYNVNPAISATAIIKLSKTFTLRDNLVLEPEVRYGEYITDESNFAGFGIAMKYKIR
ncbi:porin family protein [Flavitalea antarctica]